MMKKIALHGLKHQELLENRWQETDLSEKETKQIITRIENILTQLPEAIRQGHERIIEERLVKDKDKILSLYDKNISVTTDRGFFSKHNQKYLEKKEITDYMCPRSVPELNERLKEREFCKHQKWRAQTEGRVGIVKNCFLGNPSTGKDFNSRNLSTAWGVLTHNLWVLARLPKADIEQDLAV